MTANHADPATRRPGQEETTIIERIALRSDRALLHDESACLPLRSRHGQCRACEHACPHEALHVRPEGISLESHCTGCGRCVAACPTEALMLPELQPLLDTPVADDEAVPPERMRIECRMVPPERHRSPTTVVPCHGALRTGLLLELACRHAEVNVIDRGWCSDCPVGTRGLSEGRKPPATPGAAHPAQAAIDAAQLWLDALEQRQRVSLLHEPLDPSLRPAALPPVDDPGPVLDRRRFFRHAIERPAGRHVPPQPMGSHGRAAYPASSRRPSPERTRQYRALSTLAERGDTVVPSEFFPALYPNGNCCDARMCEALCPTRALVVTDDGPQAWLRFDPVACIACGTCERACPEGALTLQPHGGAAVARVLYEHRRVVCRSCGETYTQPADDTGHCPSCHKTQRFINDARRQLFGAAS